MPARYYPLHFDDYIRADLTVGNATRSTKRAAKKIDDALYHILRQMGDSTSKRMRRNVLAPQPYGTSETQIVSRRRDIYETIGYRRAKNENGATLTVGAIKGTRFGRMLAVVHDQGKVIKAKRAWFFGGRMHKYLIFPPEGSPARDPGSGEQLLWANDTRKQFFEQWDVGNKIMVRRTATSDPEVGFIKAKQVTIPARRIISREFDFLRAQIAKKVPTAIRTALDVQTVRT